MSESPATGFLKKRMIVLLATLILVIAVIAIIPGLSSCPDPDRYFSAPISLRFSDLTYSTYSTHLTGPNSDLRSLCSLPLSFLMSLNSRLLAVKNLCVFAFIFLAPPLFAVMPSPGRIFAFSAFLRRRTRKSQMQNRGTRNMQPGTHRHHACYPLSHRRGESAPDSSHLHLMPPTLLFRALFTCALKSSPYFPPHETKSASRPCRHNHAGTVATAPRCRF